MKTHKAIMLIALFIVGIATTFAQVTENRKVSSFDKIKVSTGIHVKYTQGDKFSLTIEAENQNVLDVIISSVDDNTLDITIKNKSGIKQIRNVVAHVTCPTLNAISTSSGSKFTADKVTANKELEISTSSGSSLKIEQIIAPKGSSISTSSGSSCKIAKIKTPKMDLSTSSGSSSKLAGVDVSGKLSVASSSGSSSKIEGKADFISLSASSGSTIDIRSLEYNKINTSKDKGSSVKTKNGNRSSL